MEEIKKICESIGYGEVMAIASRLWVQKMKSEGMPTTGVCIPVLPMDINDEVINEYKEMNTPAFFSKK